MFLYFAAGDTKKANSLAHLIDSSILGPQKLSMLIWSIGNYIPFDLEATPNLARRFEEAGVETKPDTLAGRQVQRIVQKNAPHNFSTDERQVTQ